MKKLIVLLDGQHVGVVNSARGRLSFFYEDSWRNSPGVYPLSLSLPLSSREHQNNSVEPFIWGLLPDNEAVLKSWSQRYQESPRNAFALLSHVGEDCAGAVQFLRTDVFDDGYLENHPEPQWLEDTEVAERLHIVRSNAGAGRMPGDQGQFSLAGAQPKTALYFDGKRWGVTSGRTPTTHIIKPTTLEFNGHAENEHLCLQLAASLGLKSTESRVEFFEDVPAIVVKRYDRFIVAEAAQSRKMHAELLQAEAHALNEDGRHEEASFVENEASEDFKLAEQLRETARTKFAVRLHQEDFCQALGVHPAIKYQNQGGPGVKQIVETLRNNISSHAFVRESRKFPFAVDDDVATFIGALIFNWLVGGTDAHAKNYSLLIGNGGMVRLAPLYDVASILPYSHIDARKAKMAMKIGARYELMEISLSDWLKLAANVRLNADELIIRIRSMANELPDHLSDVISRMRQQGLDHQVIDRLGVILPERARAIASL
jgi:serine/threonine-protein kinase HipA